MMAEDKIEDRAQWQAFIEEQEKSGLSQKVFCLQRNLNLNQFVYHRSRYRKKQYRQELSNPSPFVPVNIKKENRNPAEIKIIIPNGFQCIFPISLEPTQVKRWLEVLLAC
jgi:hypothetical protein